jgi:hypothetical protein
MTTEHPVATTPTSSILPFKTLERETDAGNWVGFGSQENQQVKILDVGVKTLVEKDEAIPDGTWHGSTAKSSRRGDSAFLLKRNKSITYSSEHQSRGEMSTRRRSRCGGRRPACDDVGKSLKSEEGPTISVGDGNLIGSPKLEKNQKEEIGLQVKGAEQPKYGDAHQMHLIKKKTESRRPISRDRREMKATDSSGTEDGTCPRESTDSQKKEGYKNQHSTENQTGEKGCAKEEHTDDTGTDEPSPSQTEQKEETPLHIEGRGPLMKHDGYPRRVRTQTSASQRTTIGYNKETKDIDLRRADKDTSNDASTKNSGETTSIQSQVQHQAGGVAETAVVCPAELSRDREGQNETTALEIEDPELLKHGLHPKTLGRRNPNSRRISARDRRDVKAIATLGADKCNVEIDTVEKNQRGDNIQTQIECPLGENNSVKDEYFDAGSDESTMDHYGVDPKELRRQNSKNRVTSARDRRERTTVFSETEKGLKAAETIFQHPREAEADKEKLRGSGIEGSKASNRTSPIRRSGSRRNFELPAAGSEVRIDGESRRTHRPSARSEERPALQRSRSRKALGRHNSNLRREGATPGESRPDSRSVERTLRRGSRSVKNLANTPGDLLSPDDEDLRDHNTRGSTGRSAERTLGRSRSRRVLGRNNSNLRREGDNQGDRRPASRSNSNSKERRRAASIDSGKRHASKPSSKSPIRARSTSRNGRKRASSEDAGKGRVANLSEAGLRPRSSSLGNSKIFLDLGGHFESTSWSSLQNINSTFGSGSEIHQTAHQRVKRRMPKGMSFRECADFVMPPNDGEQMGTQHSKTEPFNSEGSSRSFGVDELQEQSGKHLPETKDFPNENAGLGSVSFHYEKPHFLSDSTHSDPIMHENAERGKEPPAHLKRQTSAQQGHERELAPFFNTFMEELSQSFSSLTGAFAPADNDNVITNSTEVSEYTTTLTKPEDLAAQQVKKEARTISSLFEAAAKQKTGHSAPRWGSTSVVSFETIEGWGSKFSSKQLVVDRAKAIELSNNDSLPFMALRPKPEPMVITIDISGKGKREKKMEISLHEETPAQDSEGTTPPGRGSRLRSGVEGRREKTEAEQLKFSAESFAKKSTKKLNSAEDGIIHSAGGENQATNLQKSGPQKERSCKSSRTGRKWEEDGIKKGTEKDIPKTTEGGANSNSRRAGKDNSQDKGEETLHEFLDFF